MVTKVLLIRILDKVMTAVAATLIVVTAVVTCLSVFFRSVVGASLPWPEEMSGNLLVWTSFAGAYLAARANGHISFDLLVDRFPAPVRKIVLTINDIILFAFFALMIGLSYKAISIVGGTSLETLPVPKGAFMAAIPICCGAMMVALIVRVYGRWVDHVEEQN
jgi:TRAP-type C4-dicarboxylate transport system permease small subunit